MERASVGDQGQQRARVPPQTFVLQCSEHLGYVRLSGALLEERSLPCIEHPPPVTSHEVGKDSARRMSSVFFDILTFGIPIGLFVFP